MDIVVVLGVLVVAIAIVEVIAVTITSKSNHNQITQATTLCDPIKKVYTIVVTMLCAHDTTSVGTAVTG